MRIGHFEVLAAAGAGGMGEVWKARDTKLGRDVAIKTLPPDFAADTERLARLEREARALAALNHPNIAAIHGLEEHDGARFLVLELVDGETLTKRLERAPLPVGEALEIALQIARALEAAHERGVIHRDLKPANVMIARDGLVKLLDFGLAKHVPVSDDDGRAQTEFATEIGAIVGTAPYMSPEQARGDAASRQSDIWSFGVLLYEMLTGLSPFEHASRPETLARILLAEPNFAALPAATPPSARHLLRRCLEKDSRRRLKDSGDVRIEVENALEDLETPAPAAALPQRSGWHRAAIGLAVVSLIAVGGFAIGYRAGPAAGGEVLRLALPAQPPRSAFPFGTIHIAISNDGSRVAYAAKSGVSIRRLRDGATATVPVGEVANPFFSPDGAWLAFMSGDEGLSKVPATGGAPELIIASTERPAGGTWGPDGTIVFATTSGLYAVPDDGSAAPRLLVAPNREAGERLYAWPQYLPDGRSVLFTIVPESIDEARIAWLDTDSLEIETVLTGATSARDLASGHLLYLSGPELKAIAFDAAAREIRGEPVTVPGMSISTARDNGAAELAVSASGTLVYIAAETRTAGFPAQVLSWVDRDGNEQPLPLPSATYRYPRVSPDGSRLAFEFDSQGNRDIWLYDLRRQSQTRLTNGPTEDMLALWSRDGQRIFFTSDRTGNFDIYSIPSDGSTGARVELARSEFEWPMFLTHDNRELVVGEDFRNMSVLDLERREIQPLLHREARNTVLDLSPDGRWIAYESDESGGQWEIFLRPYPNVMSRREQVSIAGGRYPLWDPRGTGELYYVDLEGSVMAVAVELSPTLRLGTPVKLFETNAPPPGVTGRPYDVSSVDGRFILTRRAAELEPPAVEVAVILNWLAELQELLPAAR